MQILGKFGYVYDSIKMFAKDRTIRSAPLTQEALEDLSQMIPKIKLKTVHKTDLNKVTPGNITQVTSQCIQENPGAVSEGFRKSKGLFSVEYILRKLDDEYIKKIPKEVWNYINDNMDKNYQFNYDEEKTLLEQNLNIDTISILTYINIEFLLDSIQRKELLEDLKKDELISDQEKRNKYNPDDIFKNKNKTKEDKALIELKIERWYEKIFSFLKNMFKK